MKAYKIYTSIYHDTSISDFNDCKFEGCNFSNTNYSNYEFHNCIFHNCDCSLMAIDNCTLDDVVFENSKLSGINFSRVSSFLFSVSFKECILDYTVFKKNNLKNTLFSECSIKEACFIETNLKSAGFPGCELSNTLFERSDMEKADFTTARNYYIDLDKNKIKGAKFSLPEAANLLRKYDIEIL